MFYIIFCSFLFRCLPFVLHLKSVPSCQGCQDILFIDFQSFSSFSYLELIIFMCAFFLLHVFQVFIVFVCHVCDARIKIIEIIDIGAEIFVSFNCRFNRFQSVWLLPRFSMVSTLCFMLHWISYLFLSEFLGLLGGN